MVDVWIKALNNVIIVVTNYLLGYSKTRLSLRGNTAIVKKTLKMLKLLGFRVRIEKICYDEHLIEVIDVGKPRKGLEYLERFAPLREVRVWLRFLRMLLMKQRETFDATESAILMRFMGWKAILWDLQNKGLIRIERIYGVEYDPELDIDEPLYKIHVVPK